MQLIPSELAVLRQIRDLFREAAARTYRLNLLTSRWPPLHYEAYRGGFAGLLRKGFIARSADGQAFHLTTAGMKAMVH